MFKSNQDEFTDNNAKMKSKTIGSIDDNFTDNIHEGIIPGINSGY